MTNLYNPVIDTILTRRSVRNFNQGTISKETLITIIKAGMAAPSAKNTQPWEFVIVTERTTLNRLADLLPYAKMCYHAAAAIIVCGVPEWSVKGKEIIYSVIDCSNASQNILLAAESLGLGAVFTGVYPDEERVATVRNIIGVPRDVIPLNVIPIGLPNGEELPKDKYKPERIRWEKW